MTGRRGIKVEFSSSRSRLVTQLRTGTTHHLTCNDNVPRIYLNFNPNSGISFNNYSLTIKVARLNLPGIPLLSDVNSTAVENVSHDSTGL